MRPHLRAASPAKGDLLVAPLAGAGGASSALLLLLRADIDEAAWSQLYATTSWPFPVPDTGQIAIKVIDHYGDEVTQVYEVGTP